MAPRTGARPCHRSNLVPGTSLDCANATPRPAERTIGSMNLSPPQVIIANMRRRYSPAADNGVIQLSPTADCAVGYARAKINKLSSGSSNSSMTSAPSDCEPPWIPSTPICVGTDTSASAAWQLQTGYRIRAPLGWTVPGAREPLRSLRQSFSSARDRRAAHRSSIGHPTAPRAIDLRGHL